MQPGGIITPGTPPSESQPPAAPEQPVAPPAPAPEPPQVPEPQPPEPVEPAATQAPEAGWQFSAEEEDYSNQAPAPKPVAAVNWTASEYVAHEKNAGWYMLVVLSSVAVAAIVYLITRDRVSPVVVVIFGIAFAAFGARKPQVLEYSVDNTGVHIGSKQYPYGMFRTFSVIEEDATRSILLMPLQRFNLPISVYYDPADEEKIVEALGTHLPHEERGVGPIDNFMRKIRF